MLQADGGTRTASITGGCVALADACAWLAARTGGPNPFGTLVAAVSVGIIEGEPRLDLAYLEDKDAGVDANVVMLAPDRFVEVQGTGEHGTFDRPGARPDHRPGPRRHHPALRRSAQGARLVKLLVATRSAGKQREMRRVLGAAGHEVVFPDDVGHLRATRGRPPRDLRLLRDQRPAKAEYFARGAGCRPWPMTRGSRCSRWAGAPGTRSRRWAGATGTAAEVDAANNAELLRRLRGAPEAQAAGALSLRAGAGAEGGGAPRGVRGRAAAGRILEAPEGTGGFGYDPLFFSDDLGKTFGEASPEEKDAVSHRGRALARLVEALRGD